MTPLPPAPWKYDGDKLVNDADGNHIARVMGDTDAIGTAIAALPELIAAARRAVAECPDCHHAGGSYQGRWCADARAALAKAGVTI